MLCSDKFEVWWDLYNTEGITKMFSWSRVK